MGGGQEITSGIAEGVAGSERSDGPEADIQGHRCALTLPPYSL